MIFDFWLKLNIDSRLINCFALMLFNGILMHVDGLSYHLNKLSRVSTLTSYLSSTRTFRVPEPEYLDSGVVCKTAKA